MPRAPWSSFFGLTGMGLNGNNSPFSLPTFSVNFVHEFALFFIFRPGNWETQSLSPPPPPTYKDFFATVSRESLLFAS